MKFKLFCFLLIVLPLFSLNGQNKSETYYKNAETFYWLGIEQKGDIQAFREAINWLDKAEEVSIQLQTDNDTASPLPVQERIELLRHEINEQISIAGDNFIGTFPIVRFMGQSPFINSKAFGSLEILQSPEEVAIENAVEKMIESFNAHFHGVIQIPTFVISEKNANPNLETLVRLKFNASPGIKVYLNQWIKNHLSPSDYQHFVSAGSAPGIPDNIYKVVNSEIIARITISKINQIEGVHHYELHASLFEKQKAIPHQSIITEGIVQDKRVSLLYYSITIIILLFTAIFIFIFHHHRNTGKYPSLLQILAAPVMAFAVGFLSILIVLNFLSVTMPDYQDNFGYTFWWIPVAFLLILFIPLFLIRNFILRFSFYQGMVDIASKLGAVFSAAALGVTAYLSIGFILYYNLIGLLYISTAVFSFGTLAFINGKALGNIKPLPIWYAVISAFLFPLFGLLMASSRIGYLTVPVMGSIALLAVSNRLTKRKKKENKQEKPTAFINANQLVLLTENPPYRTPKQFESLIEHCEPFINSAPCILCLTGEAGNGKTATAKQIIKHLKTKTVNSKEVLVLQAQCPEKNSTPYRPIQIALEDFFTISESDNQHNQIQELDHVFDSLFESFVPFAGIITSEPKEKQHAFNSQTELFISIYNTLKKISLKKPVIFFIDDLHWADYASKELLKFLHHSFSNQPQCQILFLYTARVFSHSDDIFSSAQNIRLQPLSYENRFELLTQDLGVETNSASAILKWTSSQKQPNGDLFWLFKTLEKLARENYFVPSSSGLKLSKEIIDSQKLPIPDEYRLAIRDELIQLKEEEKFIALAACLGLEFEVSILASAIGIDKLECLETLQLLEKKTSFICDIIEKDDVYGFTSSFTLETIRQELHLSQDGPKGLVRQIVREYHARIATVLEKSKTTAQELRIAHHYYAAGRNYAEAAIRYLLVAANHCAEIFRFREARSFLQQASEVGSFINNLEPYKLEELLVECKISMLEGSDFIPVATKCQSFLKANTSLPESVLLVFALAFYNAKWFQEAEELSKTIIDNKPEPILAAKAHHLAGISLNRQHGKQRLSHLETALELALQAEAHNPETLRTLGIINNSLGEEFSALAVTDSSAKEKAKQYFLESIRYKSMKKNNDTPGLARTYGGLGRLELFALKPDYNEALLWFQKDLDLSLQIGDVLGQTKMHSSMARCYLKLGNFDQAKQAYHQSLQMAELPSDKAYALLGLMEVYDNLPDENRVRETIESLKAIFNQQAFKPDFYLINSIDSFIKQSANPQWYASLSEHLQ